MLQLNATIPALARTAALALSCAAALALTCPAGPATAAQSTELAVALPPFPVTVSTVATDQLNSEYPLLLYRDITYFPMTWNYATALGLSIAWNERDGFSLRSGAACGPLKQNLAQAAGGVAYPLYAIPVPFPVQVNGQQIIAQEEMYPPLLYRNIVYFPMTWKFTHDAFGWTTSWDAVRGLDIRACPSAEQAPNAASRQDRLNLAGGGQVAERGGWVYKTPLLSSGGPQTLVKARADGSEEKRLSEDGATWINVAGDWLYYIAPAADRKAAIYKMRTDGTGRNVIASPEAKALWVQDGWLYYIADGLYRMKTDGTGGQRLTDAADVRSMFLQDDRIYYVREEDGRQRLYAAGLDGSAPAKVRDGVRSFIIVDDWIYYTNGENRLGKLSLDGSVSIDLHTSSRSPLSSFNYRDGWLYYVSGGFGVHGSASVERIRIDGSGREPLFEARATALYWAGEELYFPKWDMGDRRLEHLSLNELGD
ncbi:protein of unknown function [Paenibacillus sp. UNCCL117]|uniref:DUF5050 domain-containing protein n=1 Tax=unclassified Paenibacillus TaxID=185978 RepID=UPI000882A2CA|nr:MULTISPECIES: DUF5050 domain-containing protein [unclassified Paenibacillus]SDC93496.1 protein of unknown function [Paenibacillus sp. cl123]SFW29572.1 protein of unknown function [Paenibacillus sp. UNCCL117]